MELELRLLLSRGARVSESLSTRLDSVRAPERLCVSRERDDERLLERLRELELDRFFEDELPEPLERLLRDREPRWGIRPSSWKCLPPSAYPTQRDQIAL